MKAKRSKKVSKKEQILAAVLLFVGVGLILLYTLSAKEYIDSETEAIQRTLEAYTIEGSGNQFEDYDNSLDIKTDKDGYQYIINLKLDASTSLVAVEGSGYKLVLSGDNSEIDETTIIDDSGNSIEMKSSGGTVASTLNESPIDTFNLDGHVIVIKDNTYYADGIEVYIPQKATDAQPGTEGSSVSEKTEKNTTSVSQTSSADTVKTTVVNTTVQGKTIKTTTTQKVTQKITKKSTKVTTKKPKKTTTKKTTTTEEESYISPNSDLNEVVNLVNQERASRGIAPLKMKLVLNKMAQVRAKESSKVWSHTRPDGSSAETIMADYGVSYRYFGENLTSGAPTSAEAVKDWMNSPPHKAAILNKKFEYIGVGYYHYKNDPDGYKYYWSQIFYTP